jgi:hypothetical protein
MDQPTTVSIELVAADEASDASIPARVDDLREIEASDRPSASRLPLMSPAVLQVILAIGSLLVGVCCYQEFFTERPYQSFRQWIFRDLGSGKPPGQDTVAVATTNIRPGDRFLAENVRMVKAPKHNTKYPICNVQPLWGRAADATIRAGTVIDARLVRDGPSNQYSNGAYVLVVDSEILPGDIVTGKTTHYLKDEWSNKDAPTFEINFYRPNGKQLQSKRRIAPGTIIRPDQVEWVPLTP